MAPAARSGPSAIADCEAIASTPFADASCSSGTIRGASAWNAGSPNALVAPSTAPSTTSAAYESASRNVRATTAASESATTSTHFGPKRSTGMPATGPSSTAGTAHDETEDRELGGTGVEAEAGESPQGDERAPAPDRVQRLAGREQREAAVSQGGHPFRLSTRSPWSPESFDVPGGTSRPVPTATRRPYDAPMACPTCGADTPPGARFCPSCGHALVSRQDERRVATVLFADLVGFTRLSESADPEQVKNIVDRCFERLAAEIVTYGGQVDKVIGDALVAIFGAPVAHEDDAERAVRAGLRMQERLEQLNRDAGTDLRMRVGINTGEVLVGAIRAGGDYTAMGDVVNTASRLQSIAAARRGRRRSHHVRRDGACRLATSRWDR